VCCREFRIKLVNTVELVEYICESKAHSFEAFLRALESSSRFKKFIEDNCDKVRKKIRNTNSNDETVKDVLAEIELAYLLLQVDRFSRVEYECYGIEEPNPDLTVTDGKSGFAFNFEVKRIRHTDVEKRFGAWKQLVVKRVKAVPSKLAFFMNIGSFDTPIDLVDHLEAKTEDIISNITETIVASEEKIPLGSEKSYSVLGLKGVFEFNLRKPRKPTSGDTLYDGGSFPIFYTDKEYRKFGDEICDPAHLGQMRSGEVNILAISTDSDTHDDLDFGKALDSLEEHVTQGDDGFFIKKGFKGSEDFAKQLERLSGIFFRSVWVAVDFVPNILWCNDKAQCSIPNDIGKILQVMDYPRSKVSFEAFKWC
jgi:hypothetical protein